MDHGRPFVAVACLGYQVRTRRTVAGDHSCPSGASTTSCTVLAHPCSRTVLAHSDQPLVAGCRRGPWPGRASAWG